MRRGARAGNPDISARAEIPEALRAKVVFFIKKCSEARGVPKGLLGALTAACEHSIQEAKVPTRSSQCAPPPTHTPDAAGGPSCRPGLFLVAPSIFDVGQGSAFARKLGRGFFFFLLAMNSL